MHHAWLVICTIPMFAQHQAPRAHQVLTRTQTGELLRITEDRMADHRKAHPPMHELVFDKQTQQFLPRTEIVPDPGSPLLGEYGTFRVRFDEIMPPADPTTGSQLIVGTIRSSLSRVFVLEDIYPEQADEVYASELTVSTLNDQVDGLREQLRTLRRANRPPPQLIGTVIRSTCSCWRRWICLTGGRMWYIYPWQRRRLFRQWQDESGCYCPLSGTRQCRRTAGCPCEPFVLAADAEPAVFENAPPTEEDYKRQIQEAQAGRDRAASRVGEIKRAFNDGLLQARHQIRIEAPQAWQAPDKMPRNFWAVLRVTGVEWDRAADLPTLSVFADLFESEELGLPAGRRSTIPASPF